MAVSPAGEYEAGTPYVDMDGDVHANGTTIYLEVATIVADTTTGTQIGSGATEKLAFFGATPIVKPTGITQTFATADGTHAARTAVALTDSAAGTPGTTIGPLADGTTYANDVAAIRTNFSSLAVEHNKLIVDLADTAQLLNFVIDKLQLLGLLA